jgi:hypothetical protein
MCAMTALLLLRRGVAVLLVAAAWFIAPRSSFFMWLLWMAALWTIAALALPESDRLPFVTAVLLLFTASFIVPPLLHALF